VAFLKPDLPTLAQKITPLSKYKISGSLTSITVLPSEFHGENLFPARVVTTWLYVSVRDLSLSRSSSQVFFRLILSLPPRTRLAFFKPSPPFRVPLQLSPPLPPSVFYVNRALFSELFNTTRHLPVLKITPRVGRPLHRQLLSGLLFIYPLDPFPRETAAGRRSRETPQDRCVLGLLRSTQPPPRITGRVLETTFSDRPRPSPHLSPFSPLLSLLSGSPWLFFFDFSIHPSRTALRMLELKP